MVITVYSLNYINNYKVNDIFDLKMKSAYKGGLFEWGCYYGLKNIGQKVSHDW